MSKVESFFSSPALVFTAAFVLRFVLLIYGIFQDSTSALKYTDIDYYVFTDAARLTSWGSSPYDRATYRYTPILAWLLLPTSWDGLWFHFGKVIFALSDLVAGFVLFIVLRRQGMVSSQALQYASVWLLNPMVANISTRGSSEGFLCALIMLLLWSFDSGQILLCGFLLGFCVHLKIYPFIYGASMFWALRTPTTSPPSATLLSRLWDFLNISRLTLVLSSMATFFELNTICYSKYGPDFLNHTYTYHLTRLDHRHNFSIWNTLLYLSSASPKSGLDFSSLAFVPQLLLSTVLIPLLAPNDLATTMLAQTLAFVTFNKVCTSQYFLWYLIFLPLYLPRSSLSSNSRLGITVLVIWVAGQAFWLQQGYGLEFLGQAKFVPGLWVASMAFFAGNCWILGIVLGDLTQSGQPKTTVEIRNKG